MKKYKKITAAETLSAEEAILAEVKVLEDDFKYLIDGIERFIRDGRVDDAREVAAKLNESIHAGIDAVAEEIAEEE